jgi:type I protein arginine methyltransferase
MSGRVNHRLENGDSEHPSESDTSDEEPLIGEDEDGWEDAEADEEIIKAVDLFSNDEYQDIQLLIENCKTKHGFDLHKIRETLGRSACNCVLISRIRSTDHFGYHKAWTIT